MLTASTLATWLTGQGLSVPVLPGPLPTGREPPTPDVVCVLSPNAGGTPSMDGLFESPGFQVAIRGPQRRVYDERAYLAAWECDRLIRLAPWPMFIGSIWCISATRTSGPPTLVMPVPDVAERSTYTATYLFTVPALDS